MVADNENQPLVIRQLATKCKVLLVFEKALAKLSTKASGWKELGRDMTKDGERNVVSVVGEGFLMVIDPKKQKPAARKHALARVFRRYHKVNMQVSITVAAEGATAGAARRERVTFRATCRSSGTAPETSRGANVTSASITCVKQ